MGSEGWGYSVIAGSDVLTLLLFQYILYETISGLPPRFRVLPVFRSYPKVLLPATGNEI